VQIFNGNARSSSAVYLQPWRKPVGRSMCSMILIGAGGNGSNGSGGTGGGAGGAAGVANALTTKAAMVW